jgi:hypothetical protein
MGSAKVRVKTKGDGRCHTVRQVSPPVSSSRQTAECDRAKVRHIQPLLHPERTRGETMTEPDITQDEQDVEGHAGVLKRDAPQNASDARDDALNAQDDGDDDAEGHTFLVK